MATGRSDFPNQVNNVLGFPFIFRGALDVRATTINLEMKMAAVKALAELTREKVPELVLNAYSGVHIHLPCSSSSALLLYLLVYLLLHLLLQKRLLIPELPELKLKIGMPIRKN